MGYYRILLILIVCIRIQTAEYCPGTHLLPSVFRVLHVIGDDLAGPIPAPHITRYVVRSDEQQNSNMADPPLGRRGPF